MTAFWKRVGAFLAAEDGPTATEYGVMIAVICVAVISALSAFGDHMNNIYVAVNDTIPQV